MGGFQIAGDVAGGNVEARSGKWDFTEKDRTAGATTRGRHNGGAQKRLRTIGSVGQRNLRVFTKFDCAQ
jgi:hypothetical protein